MTPQPVDELLKETLAHPWDELKSISILRELASRVAGASTDWEEPERWGSVLVDRSTLAAVWMRGPLAIVVTGELGVPADAAREVLVARGVRLLRVEAMGHEGLRASRGLVEQLAGHEVTDQIDWSCFCAGDLVYATR